MKKLLLILVTISASASAQVDLGELSATPYAPESTANPYGPHGSPYSSTCINNPYGESGSPNSSRSANNPYATEVPRIVAPDGTTNRCPMRPWWKGISLANKSLGFPL